MFGTLPARSRTRWYSSRSLPVAASSETILTHAILVPLSAHAQIGRSTTFHLHGRCMAGKVLRRLPNTSARVHKRCLWGLGSDGVAFEEEEEQPGRERQDAPSVL